MKIFLSGSLSPQSRVPALARALDDEGFEVWLGDSLSRGEDWRDVILSEIKTCDLFVAVLEGTNPNVLFELGYAMGGGRRVLLVCSPNIPVPFDVASLPVVSSDLIDPVSLSSAVERIKKAAVGPAKAKREFRGAVDMLRAMCEDESYLDEVRPKEFEECVAAVLRENGFDAALVPPREDIGFDIAVTDPKTGQKSIVEIKKRNRNARVSVDEVLRLVGVATTARSDAAMMVTAGGFTLSARDVAVRAPIPVFLLTADQLINFKPTDLHAK